MSTWPLFPDAILANRAWLEVRIQDLDRSVLFTLSLSDFKVREGEITVTVEQLKKIGKKNLRKEHNPTAGNTLDLAAPLNIRARCVCVCACVCERERERGRGRTRPGATNGSRPKSEQTRPIIIMVCITTRGTCRQSSRPQGHSKLGANLSPSVCRLSLYRPAQDARYSVTVLSTILYVSCPQRLPPLFPLPTFPSRQVASGGESMGVEIAPGFLLRRRVHYALTIMAAYSAVKASPV